MIKVQNNSIATRDPIPSFLAGLAPESLADLSWTDPSLGVQDCAWWPEDDTSPAIDHDTERYGNETLTPDAARCVVVVTRAVIKLTADELAEIRRVRTPDVVTMRQARLALLAAGKLDDVDAAIASQPSPQREASRIEWDYARDVQRDSALVNMLGQALGLDAPDLDALFMEAAQL